jgi:DNA invertase Pin-like site-specific DNA recombinase
MRAAIYARVSTTSGQTCENQLLELRRYVEIRGWTLKEYVDEGVSGAKDRRPALDQLVADANAGGSTCWSVGDWTAWGETYGTSFCCWTSCTQLA